MSERNKASEMAPFALSSALPMTHSHDPTMARRFGITQPISMAPPAAKELLMTAELVQTLRDFKSFESDEEARKRGTVLGKIYELVKQFVVDACVKKGYPAAEALQLGGKIFTFGSYRLGVHGSGADIDTLCVVPRYVTREDFFAILYEMLKARPEVSGLTAVPDAYVPLITMDFDSIPIDLIFAKLALPQIPENLELDTKLLYGLDEREIRSLNGSRVTDEILRLVPDVNEFRIALRTIKLWAKNRAIYANVLGFFGGVAWAMLVARVCQLYPTASASVIVCKFFHVMKAWPWPNPIMLKPPEDGPLNARQWNPRLYPADRAHLMPIITPAYPSMCATHNVTHATKDIMCREFAAAVDITDRVMLGQTPWFGLFERFRFFHSYHWFLQIVASSDSKDTQLKFSGMVESKLRHLVMRLENTPGLALLQPYMHTYDRNYLYYTDEERLKITLGGWPTPVPDDLTTRPLTTDEITRLMAQSSIATPVSPTSLTGATNTVTTSISAEIPSGIPPPQTTTSSTTPINSSSPINPIDSIQSNVTLPPRIIYTTSFYIGMQIVNPKDGGPKKRYEIFYPIEEFKSIVQGWDGYDASHMHVTVQNLKNIQLADDLFEPGETKPMPKSKKRVQASQANGTAEVNKRSKPSLQTTS